MEAIRELDETGLRDILTFALVARKLEDVHAYLSNESNNTAAGNN